MIVNGRKCINWRVLGGETGRSEGIKLLHGDMIFGPLPDVTASRDDQRINRMIIKFRSESQWTKIVSACICRHVREEVVDQNSYPRVIRSRVT